MNKYVFREIRDTDKDAFERIFNYYINNSMAAYGEEQVSDETFDIFRKSTEKFGFYVIDCDDEVVGFGFVRPYNVVKSFDRSAQLTYFILPEHTRKGLGSKFLALLTERAKEKDVDTLLAHISSANERSIQFHRKLGFEECGRFKRIGKKFGQDFDVVWMQKFI